MSVAAVPHRPARRRPPTPTGGPVELAPPPGPTPAGPGWVSGLLPALSMLPVLALGATGHARGTGLLLALLVIPAVGGTVAVHVTMRRRQRQESRRARARWWAHLSDCVAVVAAAAELQRLDTDRRHPADLTAALVGGAAFERRPGDDDALTVTVGSGSVPALRPLLRGRAGALEDIDPELAAAADRAVAAAATLPAAPVLVDLAASRVLAVVGTPAQTGPVLARVVGELAALHAPGELSLGGAGQRWAADLPHVRGVAACFGADQAAVARWLAAPADTLLRVAVVSSYTPGGCRELDAALAEPGAVAVVGCTHAAAVPATAGAVLDVPGRSLRRSDLTCPLDAVETLGSAAAQQLCTALSRYAPDTSATRPGLANLLARPRGQELEVPIGLDPAGSPVLLRLAESAVGGDGPHGLLVGATGSGKSVLLRTIVAGLAARHSPAELSLLLVDYKGGAAFAELAALPHVGGLVTNLAEEPALLSRVALALGAELERRQRVLRAAGAESRRAQLAQQGGGLPALLVAVDEAGELLAADPALADVFARIGRVGRSLGVHLLLSTQHWDPGRLHSLDAHLRYRLCLRTFTAEDSRAVLGTDAAIRLPARSGAGWLAVDGSSRRVDVLPPPADPRALVPAWPGRTEPVWLPPLPADLGWPGDGSIGLTDRSTSRTQPALRIDWAGAGGHVAVAGGPRSGVSTTLQAVVVAACADAGPDALHVHVLDLTGGLGGLAGLPQVGTVAGPAEHALVRAVVAAVRGQLARRVSGRPGPRLLLVVDGAGQLRSDDGSVEEAIADIAARGLAHDVHLVLGVRRWSELRGGLFDACGTRLELRLGDAAESLAGRATAAALPAGVPGRGLLPDGTPLQVARPQLGAVPAWSGRVRPIVLLPNRVAEPAPAGTPGGGFPLGLCAPDARPVTLDVLAPGRHLVVSGDTGSGRSTVLRRLVRHLTAPGHAPVAVHLVDPRRGLLALAPLTSTWSHAPEAAAKVLAALVATLRRRLPGADAGPAELAARARGAAGPGIAHVVVVDDLDLIDGGGMLAGPLAVLWSELAALLPYAPEVGLHLVLARPAAARGLDPLAQRLRAAGPWTLQLPGEHLEGPAAGRAAPTVVGRAVLARGGGVARTVQCYLDDGPRPTSAGSAGHPE